MITVTKTGDNIIVDPCLQEEHVAEARLSLSIKKDDRICAMQKGGLGTFTRKEIDSSIELAIDKSKQIRKMILDIVKK